MAAASFQRVPFGEVGASRLQALQSAKNRQNAVSDMLKSPMTDKVAGLKTPFTPFKPSAFNLTSPSKRSASVLEEDNASDSDHNSDAENVDPSTVHLAKRAKVEDSGKSSKPQFSLFTKPSTPVTSNAQAKRKHALETTGDASPFAAPASAPAGRTFAHPRVSGLSKNRPSLSPFRRIDPPAFSFSKASGSLPFSIDAALRGTFSKPSPAPEKVRSLKRAQPKGWFFDIHEDTLDEEMTIIMEHSTGTLDLSSDDEQGPAQKKAKRGKENVAPEDYVPQARTRPAVFDVMSDDDGDRSPLSDLAPEEYFANGLDRDSVAVLADDGFPTVEGNATTAEREVDAVPAAVEAARPAVADSAPDASVGFLIAEDPADV